MTICLKTVFSETVSLKSIEWDLEWPSGSATNVIPLHIMPRDGKAPTIFASAHARRGTMDPSVNTKIVIDLNEPGFPCRLVGNSLEAAGLNLSPFVPYGMCILEEGLLFIQDEETIVYLPSHQDAKPYHLHVTNPIKMAITPQNSHRHLFPVWHLRAEGSVIPVPFRGSDSKIAYLHLDIPSRSVTWGLKAMPQENTFTFRKIFNFRKNNTIRTTIEPKGLLSVYPFDLPEFSGSRAHIQAASSSQGRTLIFTTGRSPIIVTSPPFCCIAQIDESGLIKKILFCEDYSNKPENEIHGFGGWFSQSGEYFLKEYLGNTDKCIESNYSAFHISTQTTHTFKFPPSFTGAEIRDHAYGIFWTIDKTNDDGIRILGFCEV